MDAKRADEDEPSFGTEKEKDKRRKRKDRDHMAGG
jgi:hypothetical protein